MEYNHLNLLVVVFPFDVFVPTSGYTLLFLDKWSIQIYLNVNFQVLEGLPN